MLFLFLFLCLIRVISCEEDEFVHGFPVVPGSNHSNSQSFVCVNLKNVADPWFLTATEYAAGVQAALVNDIRPINDGNEICVENIDIQLHGGDEVVEYRRRLQSFSTGLLRQAFLRPSPYATPSHVGVVASALTPAVHIPPSHIAPVVTQIPVVARTAATSVADTASYSSAIVSKRARHTNDVMYKGAVKANEILDKYNQLKEEEPNNEMVSLIDTVDDIFRDSPTQPPVVLPVTTEEIGLFGQNSDMRNFTETKQEIESLMGGNRRHPNQHIQHVKAEASPQLEAVNNMVASGFNSALRWMGAHGTAGFPVQKPTTAESVKSSLQDLDVRPTDGRAVASVMAANSVVTSVLDGYYGEDLNGMSNVPVAQSATPEYPGVEATKAAAQIVKQTPVFSSASAAVQTATQGHGFVANTLFSPAESPTVEPQMKGQTNNEDVVVTSRGILEAQQLRTERQELEDRLAKMGLTAHEIHNTKALPAGFSASRRALIHSEDFYSHCDCAGAEEVVGCAIMDDGVDLVCFSALGNVAGLRSLWDVVKSISYVTENGGDAVVISDQLVDSITMGWSDDNTKEMQYLLTNVFRKASDAGVSLIVCGSPEEHSASCGVLEYMQALSSEYNGRRLQETFVGHPKVSLGNALGEGIRKVGGIKTDVPQICELQDTMLVGTSYDVRVVDRLERCHKLCADDDFVECEYYSYVPRRQRCYRYDRYGVVGMQTQKAVVSGLGSCVDNTAPSSVDERGLQDRQQRQGGFTSNTKKTGGTSPATFSASQLDRSQGQNRRSENVEESVPLPGVIYAVQGQGQGIVQTGSSLVNALTNPAVAAVPVATPFLNGPVPGSMLVSETVEAFQGNPAPVLAGSRFVGQAEEMASDASNFVNTASLVMQASSKFMQVVPVTEMAQAGAQLYNSGFLRNRGMRPLKGPSLGLEKNNLRPPPGLALPEAKCMTRGVTCCAPREAATTYQVNPPTLNGVDDPICEVRYVAATDQLCATSAFDDNTCGTKVVETANFRLFQNRLFMPGRAMNNVLCNCKQSKVPDKNGRYETQGYATWEYSLDAINKSEDVDNEASDSAGKFAQGAATALAWSKMISERGGSAPAQQRLPNGSFRMLAELPDVDESGQECMVPWPEHCEVWPAECDPRGPACSSVAIIEDGCPKRDLQMIVERKEAGILTFQMKDFMFMHGAPFRVSCSYSFWECGAASVSNACGAGFGAERSSTPIILEVEVQPQAGVEPSIYLELL